MSKPIFGYHYNKCVCSKCGRKILVEKILIGVSHTTHTQAMCLDCLIEKGVDEDFKEKHPEAAKDMEEWYNEEEEP